MDTALLNKKFGAIGARLQVRSAGAIRSWNRPRDYTLDVTATRNGEVFELVVAREGLDARVLHADPADRHLLLMVDGRKFLCGHDERHWFVAGVSGAATSVGEAKDLLMPAPVRMRLAIQHVKAKNRHRRRNDAFIRQGEWFFVPAPDLRPDAWLVLQHEPIRRGRGKPHMVEFLYRRGGTTVQVCPQYPNGLTQREYTELIKKEPEKRQLRWHVMSRQPEAFARGRVRHPDHKTIVLPYWHRIHINEEVRSQNVAFLD